MDGIINKDEFKSPKILFVLKETNQYDKPLTEFLRKLFTEKQIHKRGYNFQMWHTVSKWAYGIIEKFKSLKEANKRSIYKSYLQKIAVINLKKVPGREKSKEADIRNHALKDKEIIKKQIDDIIPEFIIACGTYEILLEVLEIKSDLEYAKYNNSIIIKLRHPNRANQLKTYNELKEKIEIARTSLKMV